MKRTGWRSLVLGISGGILLLAMVFGGILYSWVARPAFIHLDQDTVMFYVRTGSDYDQVYHDLIVDGRFRSPKGLNWVAQKKGYPDMVRPGRYTLSKGMSNTAVINLLRSGKQTEVNLVFNSTRHFERLAGILGRQLEPDSLEFLTAFRDTARILRYHFELHSWQSMFLPNTYRFFWTATVDDFFDRMFSEYEVFWGSRDSLAKKIGLSRIEVVTLASIVQEETVKADEMARVAGVYMNRLRQGIRLQADPTVLFAIQDPSIQRVLYKHLRIDSPYNTYRIKGLPPGPIRIPSLQAIDASLHYERHNYLYFCAKEDFSGYHAFASSYAEHMKNARRYQRILNQRSK